MNSKTINNIDFRWQCRRGMLELDLLLNNYVTKKADALTLEQSKTFECLLAYPDQTLLDLLLGTAISSDPLIADIVNKIRTTAFD